MGFNKMLKYAKTIAKLYLFLIMLLSSILQRFLFWTIFRRRIINQNQETILDKDWDILIILDACRYDVFAEILKKINLDGTLSPALATGSSTVEFLIHNFKKDDERIQEIIYVTANPFVNIFLEGKVRTIIPVWKYDWDNETGTVHPYSVYKHALKAVKKYYPSYRIIIHFIQPHYPFLSIKMKVLSLEKLRVMASRGVRSSSVMKVFRIMGFLELENAYILTHPLELLWPLKVFDNVIYVLLGKTILRNAYTKNLETVLKYVKKLIDCCPGRIVITADHGDGLGDRIGLFPIEIYGHPPRMRIKPLILVPWFETFGKGNLREITKEILRLKLLEIKSKVMR